MTTSPHHSGLGLPHHSWLGLGKYQSIQSNRHKNSSESKSKVLLHLKTQCVFINICIIHVSSLSDKSNFLCLCLCLSTYSFTVGTSPSLHPMDTQLGCLSRSRSCPSALFLHRGAAKLEMVYLPHQLELYRVSCIWYRRGHCRHICERL